MTTLFEISVFILVYLGIGVLIRVPLGVAWMCYHHVHTLRKNTRCHESWVRWFRQRVRDEEPPTKFCGTVFWPVILTAYLLSWTCANIIMLIRHGIVFAGRLIP